MSLQDERGEQKPFGDSTDDVGARFCWMLRAVFWVGLGLIVSGVLLFALGIGGSLDASLFGGSIKTDAASLLVILLGAHMVRYCLRQARKSLSPEARRPLLERVTETLVEIRARKGEMRSQSTASSGGRLGGPPRPSSQDGDSSGGRPKRSATRKGSRRCGFEVL